MIAPAPPQAPSWADRIAELLDNQLIAHKTLTTLQRTGEWDVRAQLRATERQIDVYAAQLAGLRMGGQS